MAERDISIIMINSIHFAIIDLETGPKWYAFVVGFVY